MNITSANKVMDAGFRVIRCDDQPSIRIKERSGNNGAWRTIENFTSKAARDRRFKAMLLDPMIIED